MKNLLLILALITLGFTSNAQTNLDSNALITYQITPDSSVIFPDGTIMPDTFYISVTGFSLERDGQFYFIATIQTYTNPTNVIKITNPDFKNGRRFYVTLNQLATLTPIQIFSQTVKAYLNFVYGSDNVSKLN